MIAQPINTLAAAFLITIIGALPFGLVNLTVKWVFSGFMPALVFLTYPDHPSWPKI